MSLIQTYNKNKGEEIFSEIIIHDWYDDVVTGVCKLKDTEEWYICNLCYFNPGKRQRIWTLVQVSTIWVKKFKAVEEHVKSDSNGYQIVNDEIKRAYYSAVETVYLLTAENFSIANGQIVELPLSYRKYFDNIEEVVDLDADSLQQWKAFFSDGLFE